MGLWIYTTEHGVWWDVLWGSRSGCEQRPFPLQPQKSMRLVPWHAIREVALVDPWPSFRLLYDDFQGRETTQTFHPQRLHRVLQFTPSQQAQLSFERAVIRAHQRLSHRCRNAASDPGWSLIPVTEWERIDQLPEFLSSGDGAYRSAASPVIARRRPAGALGTVRAWLRASPEMQWGKTAKEILLTADTLYVRQWDDEVWALPRNTLRLRFFHSGRHATYVFGRRGFLVLRHREGCEVRRELDQQLGE